MPIAAPTRSCFQCRLNVGVREIVSFEQKRFSLLPSQGIGKTVTEVQLRLVAGSFSERAVRGVLQCVCKWGLVLMVRDWVSWAGKDLM